MYNLFRFNLGVYNAVNELFIVTLALSKPSSVKFVQTFESVDKILDMTTQVKTN